MAILPISQPFLFYGSFDNLIPARAAAASFWSAISPFWPAERVHFPEVVQNAARDLYRELDPSPRSITNLTWKDKKKDFNHSFQRKGAIRRRSLQSTVISFSAKKRLIFFVLQRSLFAFHKLNLEV